MRFLLTYSNFIYRKSTTRILFDSIKCKVGSQISNRTARGKVNQLVSKWELEIFSEDM